MNNEHQIAQVMLRSWPFPRGAGRLIDRYFSNLSFKRSTAIVRTTDDFDITVMPNDLIGRHIYLTGEFDRSIVEVLCNFAEPGDALLDIGANIGYVSTCFLKNIPHSSVIAVEPQPEVIKLLTTNLNRFGRSRIYPFAVTDRDGEGWLQANPSNTGAGRIVPGCDTRNTKINTKSAHSMFTELNIERLDLVKIDAEGFESTIVRSCLDHFKRHQPRAIVFEDQSRARGEIGSMLQQIGYRVFGIQKTLRRLSLVENSNSTHDYVAISSYRSLPIRASATYGIA
jgi:FkbM family methyltransferase